MGKKIWLYSGLVVVILAMMGIGIWAVLSPKNPVEIPESDPVVLMDINNPEEGTLSQLSIYEDGTVIFVEDSAEEMPLSQGDKFTRTWRTGTIKTADIDSLFDYLDSVDFSALKETYVADNVTQEEVDAETVDYMTISADNGDIYNNVAVFGYGKSYSELPAPLNTIYTDLTEIIEENTKEVLVEKLTE